MEENRLDSEIVTTEPASFPSSPELKQTRSRASTSRLLRAAVVLIAERGYNKTTLAAIGTEAGYSHGLVTRRFGSKDGLLDALLQRLIEDWRQREVAPLLQEASGAEGLCVVIRGIRGSLRRDPTAMRALYTLMFEGHRSPPAILHERMRDFQRDQLRLFGHVVKIGIQQGTVRPEIDPRTTARLTISTLRGAAYQWLLDPEFDIDATLASLEEHLVQSLAPRPTGGSLIPDGARGENAIVWPPLLSPHPP